MRNEVPEVGNGKDSGWLPGGGRRFGEYCVLVPGWVRRPCRVHEASDIWPLCVLLSLDLLPKLFEVLVQSRNENRIAERRNVV